MADKKAFRELRYREMQRDIRFRAWHGERMYLWDWLLGNFISSIFNDAWTLMQFTGIKDKAGKEIWQDDLIQDSSGQTCIVKWHKCLAGWDAWDDVAMKFMGQKGNFKPNNWPDAVMVIGNIYEGLCVK